MNDRIFEVRVPLPMQEVSEGRALLSDVWSSRDGYEWAKATHSSPWAARRDHSLVLAGV